MIAASRPTSFFSVFGAVVGVVRRPYFAAKSAELRPVCSIAFLQTELVLWRSPCEALSPAARSAAYFSTHSLMTPDSSGLAESCFVSVIHLVAEFFQRRPTRVFNWFGAGALLDVQVSTTMRAQALAVL